MPQQDIFPTLTDKELLTLCIYGEARGEPPVGKLAVAHVILNRAANPCWWGDSVKSVILKHRQFSCFNEDDVNRSAMLLMAKTGMYDPACLAVALLAIEGHTTDPTKGATHYHAIGIAPAWSAKMKRTAKINRHVFYQEGE